MTDELKTIESKMLEFGYKPIKASTTQVNDRDFYFETGANRSDNKRAGAFGSGVVRASRKIQIVINFRKKNDRKQLQSIWENIDAIVGAIYGQNDLIWDESTVSETDLPGFVLAYIDFTLFDDISLNGG